MVAATERRNGQANQVQTPQVQILRWSIIFFVMNNGVKLALGLMGLLLLAVTPYFWFVNPALLWFAVPLLCAWAFWLMTEYLRWAKTLGKK